MTSAAVTFEYEWMDDGSLRVRFLNEENAILGQQLVATEGLTALQLLISLAIAKSTDVSPEKMVDIFRTVGIDADLDATAFLQESIRVRAETTPEGNIGIDVVEDGD
jgi:hypothetical protein